MLKSNVHGVEQKTHNMAKERGSYGVAEEYGKEFVEAKEGETHVELGRRQGRWKVIGYW